MNPWLDFLKHTAEIQKSRHVTCWLNGHGRSGAKQREQDNLTVYKLTFECCLGSETDFLLCLVLFFS